MKNSAEIYKQYVLLKLSEKQYSRRLEILSKQHALDEEVVAKILEDEEAKCETVRTRK